ncbi:restriction endonuclease subunit S [Flagellimonas oceanensis]|uniref:restriction endonuclease subunit S n=1 Tax=Flagellimonas oceanensis TaxID=2499163 RepID=UPI000F8DBEB4|nr:restriction endonuclease subunit S [Allomuricauda oceanensis]
METVAENTTGLRRIKIGWIPAEWDYLPLSDISLKITDGAHYSPPSVDEDVGYPMYSIKNMSNIDFKRNQPRFISKDVFDSLIKQGCQPELGDIVIAKDGSVLRYCFVITEKFDGVLLSSVAILKPNTKIVYPEFVCQFLKLPHVRNYVVKALTTGTGVPRIVLKDFRGLKIALPNKNEQLKIASILSEWDKAIKITQTLIDKLKLRKKGLCQQLLTGNIRLTGFSKEWKEITLGEITDRITNKNEELNDTVVTISAQRGFVKQEDFFNKRVASSTLSGYYLIKRGNFAYNKSYSSGYPMGAFKRLDDFDKAVVTTLYICFSVKENIDSDFLLNYFEAGLMIKNLMRIAQEGGRAHGLLNISLKDFFDLKLIIPTIEEQKAIANVLNKVDKEIECQEAYLKHLQLQKKGLMQQLLTGKIRVN